MPYFSPPLTFEGREKRKHRPPRGTRLPKGRCREARLWSRNDIPLKAIIYDGESLRAFRGSETCHPRGCKPKIPADESRTRQEVGRLDEWHHLSTRKGAQGTKGGLLPARPLIIHAIPKQKSANFSCCKSSSALPEKTILPLMRK